MARAKKKYADEVVIPEEPVVNPTPISPPKAARNRFLIALAGVAAVGILYAVFN